LSDEDGQDEQDSVLVVNLPCFLESKTENCDHISL